MPTALPLLVHAPNETVAWREGAAVTVAQFLGDVAHLAGRLPPRGHVLNLCEDRYHFLVGFAAALQAGLVSLLPPNRSRAMLAQLREQYDDLGALFDTAERPEGIVAIPVTRAPEAVAVGTIPAVPVDRVAAVTFTSGTTGQPQPHPKRWGSLVRVAVLSAMRFGLARERPVTAIATVPAQHMFGIEASIMLPLQCGGVVHGARPFFPEDIRTALTAAPDSVLITTPLHLRACVESGLRFPAPRFVLSATAALNDALAQRAEQVFGAPVLEIYGCTEAGTMATRRTVRDATWRLLEGLIVRLTAGGAYVSGPHLAEPIVLGDCVELQADGRLRLLGRKADLVNIAGKRASLADLNLKLLDIPGVIDGTFLVPDGPDDAAQRLIALVVAPTLTHAQILARLRDCLDPVFLPRPLYLVDKLPRNATGKLAFAELRGMAARCEAAALGGAR